MTVQQIAAPVRRSEAEQGMAITLSSLGRVLPKREALRVLGDMMKDAEGMIRECRRVTEVLRLNVIPLHAARPPAAGRQAEQVNARLRACQSLVDEIRHQIEMVEAGA